MTSTFKFRALFLATLLTASAFLNVSDFLNVSTLAPGTAAYTAQLKPKKQIKLTGTVEDFDEYKHVIWLKDCRPAAK